MIQQNVDKRALQSVTSVSFQNLEAPTASRFLYALYSQALEPYLLEFESITQRRRAFPARRLSRASFAPPRMFFCFNRWDAIRHACSMPLPELGFHPFEDGSHDQPFSPRSTRTKTFVSTSRGSSKAADFPGLFSNPTPGAHLVPYARARGVPQRPARTPSHKKSGHAPRKIMRRISTPCFDV